MLKVLGHEKIEKLVSIGVEVAKAFQKSLADGSLDWSDVTNFAPLVLEVKPFIEALVGVGAEIKTFGPQDFLELAELILEKLGGVLSEDLAKKIKQGLVAVMEIAKFIALFA